MGNLPYFVFVCFSLLCLSPLLAVEEHWYHLYKGKQLIGYRHDTWIEDFQYKQQQGFKLIMDLYQKLPEKEQYFLAHRQEFLWNEQMQPLAATTFFYQGKILETVQAEIIENKIVLERNISGKLFKSQLASAQDIHFSIPGKLLLSAKFLKKKQRSFRIFNLGDESITSEHYRFKKKKKIKHSKETYNAYIVEKTIGSSPPLTHTIFYNQDGVVIKSRSITGRLVLVKEPPDPTQVTSIPQVPAPIPPDENFVLHNQPHYSFFLPKLEWQEGTGSIFGAEFSQESEIGQVDIYLNTTSKSLRQLAHNTLNKIKKNTIQDKVLAKRKIFLGEREAVQFLVQAQRSNNKKYAYFATCLRDEQKGVQAIISGEWEKQYLQHWPSWLEILHTLSLR